MPRRRRPDHGRVAFELDTGPEPADAAEVGPDDGAPAGASADQGSTDGDAAGAGHDSAHANDTARRRRRRGALLAAAAVVLVVGGMVAVDAGASRGSFETLRHSAGGVEPLPDAPRELWTVPAQGTETPATLPGLVVLVRDGEAVAHDLDTGEVRWTVQLPRTSRCGGELLSSATAPVPDDVLVCVTHDLPSPLEARTVVTPRTDEPVPGDGAEVTVIDADGDAETRTLDASRGWSAPGPDGTVARFRRAGEAPDPAPRVEVDPATQRPTDVSSGRPAVVTLEDARTGDVFWENELPFVPDEGGCGQYSDAEGVTYADLDGAMITLEAGLVVVQGCGVDAWFTADGQRVDDPSAPTDRLVRMPGGGLSRTVARDAVADGSGGRTPPVVLEPDGEPRWEPPGAVLVPQATDGTADDLVLALEVTDIVAHDATGVRRWETRDVNSPSAAYVVAGGSAVVLQGMGNVVVGVDVETGRSLWTLASAALAPPRSAAEERAAAPVTTLATQAFTDGTRAILGTTEFAGSGEGATQLVALDLRDGQVVWRTDATSGASYLAVQGRLLRVDDSTVTRLG